MNNYNRFNKVNHYESQKKLLNAWDNKSSNYKIRLLKKERIRIWTKLQLMVKLSLVQEVM